MCSHSLSMFIPFSQALRTTNTRRGIDLVWTNRHPANQPSGETTRYRPPDLPHCNIPLYRLSQSNVLIVIYVHVSFSSLLSTLDP